jgi:DNA polymerase III epsilon subunit-like protein
LIDLFGRKMVSIFTMSQAAKIVIFDTETTGLPTMRRISAMDMKDNWPDLVSICWRTFVNRVEVTKHYYVIKPMGWVIPEEASKIHGITNEVASEGHDMKEVLALFREDIINADRIVAHNLDFDKPSPMDSGNQYNSSLRQATKRKTD